MTLADITLPVTYEWGTSHVLAFSLALCQRLVNVQAWYGDPRHVPNPVPLTDGRWCLSADVLTECLPGGLVYGGFSQLDPAGFAGIEVLTLEDVEPLWYAEDAERPAAPTPEEQPPEPEPEPEPPAE
jgi:hypothetical protein